MPNVKRKPRVLPPEKRFRVYVDRRGPEACWPWRGAVGRDGYGKLSVRGRTVRAARYAFELANGWLPVAVRQTCWNRLCCNPAHLVERPKARSPKARIRRERVKRVDRMFARGGRRYQVLVEVWRLPEEK